MAKSKVKNVEAPTANVVLKRKHKTIVNGKDKGLPTSDRWWKEEPADMYRHVNALLTSIENFQAGRRHANARFLKLYSNMSSMSYGSGGLRSSAGSASPRPYCFTLNVVESCVDTAAARIAKTRPLPEILTSGGTWKQQRKAKNLTKYLKGMMTELGVHEKSQVAFIDACIFGTGCVKFFIEDGQIKAKRVLIDDIIVDDEDGREGTPRQLHQRARVNKDVLCELYPKHIDKIRSASSLMPGERQTLSGSDMVAVVESWHLPSAEGAKDGKHVMCLDNVTLYEEDWNHDWFPFAFLRWKPRTVGFYGVGLAEQLTPLQVEISKICIRIQESIEQIARPTVFVNSSVQIVPQHIGSIPGAVVKVNGNPQQSVWSMVPQAMSEEVYSWLDWLYKKAFEVTGVSQMSAQSQKPAGLNSGAALRTFEDIEAGRFELTAQRYEDYYKAANTIVLALSAKLFAGGAKSLKVKVKDKKFLETINWKDAALEDDEFTMEMDNVSSLPNSPGGRIQTVTELMQAGYFSKEKALALLRFPDVDEAIDLETAGIENAKMVVDRMRWDGKYTAPSSLMNLAACLEIAHNAWLECQGVDTPQRNIDMLETFIAACQAKVKESQPPAPQGPPQGADPMANPAAPPMSDMLPVGVG